MSGPKHLWSGDWERHSDQAPAAYEPPAPTNPAPGPADEPEPRRSLFSRIRARGLAAGGAGALVIAAVATALVIGLGGNAKPNRPHQTTPASAPTTSANGSSASGGVAIGSGASVPQAYWLGMQILTTPLGAVVTTVALGSIGDADGFSPGDSISAIGTTQVDSVHQLRTALANVPLGQSVKVTITRGSGSLSADVTLTKRPTARP